MDSLFTTSSCTLLPKDLPPSEWTQWLMALLVAMQAQDEYPNYRSILDFMDTVHIETGKSLRTTQRNHSTLLLDIDIQWLYWINQLKRKIDPKTKPVTRQNLFVNRAWFRTQRELLDAAYHAGNSHDRERAIQFLSAWHQLISESNVVQTNIVSS